MDGAVLIDAKDFEGKIGMGMMGTIIQKVFAKTGSRKILLRGFDEDSIEKFVAKIVIDVNKSVSNESWELGIVDGRVMTDKEIFSKVGRRREKREYRMCL